MNNELIKAFEYFHAEYPDNIIAFHVSDEYLVCIPTQTTMYELRFSDEDEASIIRAFSMCKTPFRIIAYKNNAGEYILPDIELLKEEKESDY